MSQQEQIPKPGPAKRFLKGLRILIKCLWILLLVTLLIAGLYFQAPWKVLTLITIFLTAATILPKKHQKYFWLTVTCVVISLVVWVFLPEDDSDWKLFQFEDQIAAFEEKLAVPEEENAAPLYNELMQLHDESEFLHDFRFETENTIEFHPWKDQDFPQVKEWLDTHTDTIEMLLLIKHVPLCRFPFAANVFEMPKLDILGPVKRWPQILFISAYNDLGHHRYDQAIEKFQASLVTADHLYQQHTMIENLIARAIEAMAISKLSNVAIEVNFNQAQLDRIEQMLSDIKCDWSSEFRLLMESESLLTKNSYIAMFYEINSKGKTRFTRGSALMNYFADTKNACEFLYLQNKLTKANSILLWFFCPSDPHQMGEYFDLCFERNFALADPDFDWQTVNPSFSYYIPDLVDLFKFNYKHFIDFTASMSGRVYPMHHDIYLGHLARRKAAMLMILLRRYKNAHNQWPQMLDDIKTEDNDYLFVDPVNKDSFIYKLTDDNFTLYSKGKDGDDDLGIYKNKPWPDDPNDYGSFNFWENPEQDDRTYWPPKAPKVAEGSEEGTDNDTGCP